MSKKNHAPGPIPPGNQPKGAAASAELDQDESGKNAVAKGEIGGSEHDPKRRLGDYTGAGEHSRQEPGPRNDGGGRHGEDAG